MFNHHSLIPWGSFRGRQEEKWGSFRGRDHFGVDLGIISELRIISGAVKRWPEGEEDLVDPEQHGGG